MRDTAIIGEEKTGIPSFPDARKIVLDRSILSSIFLCDEVWSFPSAVGIPKLMILSFHFTYV